MNYDAFLTNLVTAPPPDIAATARGSHTGENGAVEWFDTRQSVQPGPITDAECLRIKAAKKMKSNTISKEERAQYQKVKALLLSGKNRPEIHRECQHIKGLGQHNLDTIITTLLRGDRM